jgi:hypothetical protein
MIESKVQRNKGVALSSIRSGYALFTYRKRVLMSCSRKDSKQTTLVKICMQQRANLNQIITSSLMWVHHFIAIVKSNIYT